MTGFSIAWLDLREPADSRARDKSLAVQALQWLQKNNSSQSSIVVDLGSGTGSTLRAIEPLGAGNNIWRLVDNDGGLLDEALRRHGKNIVIEDYQADLNIINELPLKGASLVTASALFDLVSPKFLDELVQQLSSQNTALYAALNYDGTIEWTPSHSLDYLVLDAFNEDQKRNKGFGPALGPDATDYLTRILQAQNYSVLVADSPWLLNGKDQLLIAELIDGIANAVEENINEAQLKELRLFRLDHLTDGSCRVGHTDLLALPVKIIN